MALPRTVLVTGANRGIGLGFVKHFLAAGPEPKKIFATCRSTAGSEARRELDELEKAHQGRLHVVQMDVCDSSSLERAAASVAAVIGDLGLNVLINNAGIFPNLKTLESVDAVALLHCFQTNTVGPTVTAKVFLPLLRKASSQAVDLPMGWARAAIVNISSGLGSIGNNNRGGSYGYRASKAALNQVTKTLSIDLRPDTIMALSVCPGWVQTDMGTKDAHLTVESSVSAMTAFFATIGESNTGAFVNRHGKTIDY